jgi:hypothetical protein
VESLFRLGVVCARQGDLRNASVWLRRARRFDLEEKWSWEVERELERLSPASSSASVGASSTQKSEAERNPV